MVGPLTLQVCNSDRPEACTVAESNKGVRSLVAVVIATVSIDHGAAPRCDGEILSTLYRSVPDDRRVPKRSTLPPSNNSIRQLKLKSKKRV